MRADHHSRIRSRDDEPLCYRNSEGYTDPTAFFALRSVMKESKPIPKLTIPPGRSSGTTTASTGCWWTGPPLPPAIASLMLPRLLLIQSSKGRREEPVADLQEELQRFSIAMRSTSISAIPTHPLWKVPLRVSTQMTG